jgi:hypothetical protein
MDENTAIHGVVDTVHEQVYLPVHVRDRLLQDIYRVVRDAITERVRSIRRDFPGDGYAAEGYDQGFRDGIVFALDQVDQPATDAAGGEG